MFWFAWSIYLSLIIAMIIKKITIITLYAVLVTAQQECGIPKIGGNSLILYGQETAPGDWPWHAAIYHRIDLTDTYVCGGTIISSEFIVTAAHCVVNNRNKYQLTQDRIFVRLGIHDLYALNSASMQQHYVGKMFKFKNFTEFIDDIALIKLSTIIIFNNYVQPACIKAEPVVTGEHGTVLGWGLTENDKISPILQKVDIPVVDMITCLKSDRGWFSQIMDYGLFCAGYTNGTGVCNGDSGGGIFFPRGNRWFLGGIVSSSPKQDRRDGNCGVNSYGAFTNVYHYLPWISEITEMHFQRKDSVREVVVPKDTDNVAICQAVEPNQANISPNLLPRRCGDFIPDRIVGGTKAKVFQFPWMALLMKNDTHFFCTGTLISKRYILTASRCFRSSLLKKVRLGEHTLEQDIDCNGSDKDDCAPPVQDYNIECFTKHPDYSEWLKTNDIGLIRLSEDVQPKDHIHPVCLPHTQRLRNYQPPQYIVTGWGAQVWNGEPSKVLLKATIPAANKSECLLYNSLFPPDMSRETFLCAGAEHLDACTGDAGAPLGYGANIYGTYNIRFVQFGINSVGTSPCGASPSFYTNVSYYMDWIIANMKP